MANLSKINFMSASQFDALTATNDDELYFVNASGMALLGEDYVDLTLGASGDSYTAPANGWFAIRKISNAATGNVQLATNGLSMLSVSNSTTQPVCCFIPVRKGETVTVYYGATGLTEYFRFIYAPGEI